MSLRVGVIGAGTVGGGVIEVLRTHGDEIAARADREIRVTKVCARTKSRLDGIDTNGIEITDDIDAVVNDPDVDVVCELIGGEEPAKSLTLRALSAGKHVVTANKMLLALHGPELCKAAINNNADLRFEAAVAGGIPIIKALREGLVSNKMDYAFGILNGTCNYILSRMTYEGLEFEPVLQQAVEQGFAETPPDLDIDGHDAAHKCQIIASLCFSTEVDLGDIYTEGIRNVTHADVENAQELGYVIKLLAVVRDLGESIEARVHPTLVPDDHLLASVRNEFNGVYVQGDVTDATMYYGRGAGRFPTTSAVIADIVDIARRGDATPPPPFVYGGRKPVQDINETRTRYYIRFTTEDSPGVLATITSRLSEHQVSIASIIQHEEHPEHGVPIVLMTYETVESAVMAAIKEIEDSGVTRAETHCIRVL